MGCPEANGDAPTTVARDGEEKPAAASDAAASDAVPPPDAQRPLTGALPEEQHAPVAADGQEAAASAEVAVLPPPPPLPAFPPPAAGDGDLPVLPPPIFPPPPMFPPLMAQGPAGSGLPAPELPPALVPLPPGVAPFVMPPPPALPALGLPGAAEGYPLGMMQLLAQGGAPGAALGPGGPAPRAHDGGPEVLEVWGRYLESYREYALELSRLTKAAAGPGGDPEAPLLQAPALGGGRPDRICVHFLTNVCYRGMRCPDRHPVNAQLKSLRTEFKRKQCRYGDQCFSPRCLYYHPREAKGDAWTDGGGGEAKVRKEAGGRETDDVIFRALAELRKSSMGAPDPEAKASEAATGDARPAEPESAGLASEGE